MVRTSNSVIGRLLLGHYPLKTTLRPAKYFDFHHCYLSKAKKPQSDLFTEVRGNPTNQLKTFKWRRLSTQNLPHKPKCYQNLRDIVKKFKKTLLNHLHTIQSPEPLYPKHDDMQSFLHQGNIEKSWNSALLTLTESMSASCSTNLFMYTVTFPPIT